MPTLKNQFDPRATIPLSGEGSFVTVTNDRLGRIRPYLVGFALFWTLCGIYFLANGLTWYPTAVCAIALLVNVGLIFCHDQKRFHKEWLVNAFLSSTCLSMTAVAMVMGIRESPVQFHFCLLSLVAAQLLGIRAAARWFLLSVLAIYFSLYPPFEIARVSNGKTFDTLLNSLALSAVVLWICDQSEKFLVRRTVYLHKLTESLKEKTRLLGLAEETAEVGHWRCDLATNHTEFSNELKRICSLEAGTDADNRIEDLISRFGESCADELQLALVQAASEGQSFAVDLWFLEQGQMRYVTCRGFCELAPDQSVVAIFGVIRDETKLKEATQRLSKKADELNRLASFDPLTGLSNRLQFRRNLSNAVTATKSQQELIALLVLDMDGFKEINDTLGHPVGDLVLQEAANRIEEHVYPGDIVSRLGGDEFTVILRDAQSIKRATHIANEIVNAIKEPMHFNETKMQVGASIGVAFCPTDSTTADELFTFADTAMYDAKFNGKDVSLYKASMTDELVRRKRIESKLANALDRNEFSVVYQPQWNVRNKQIIGFEALMRWNRDGTVVSPAEFIPLLESSGKIIEAGQWILDQACQQAQIWQQLGYETRVAVYISPIQFRDPGFYDRVLATLSKYSVAPNRIDLEITEGVIINDVARTSKTLMKLKALGCLISVDDFGTGYSSLAYLRDFPIDQLKIDRAFIKDFPNHDDGTIASSIIVLGLSLDMEVLAEGVETEEQLEFLKNHDCHNFQGNLASLPVDADTCLQLLQENGIVAGRVPLNLDFKDDGVLVFGQSKNLTSH